MTFNHQNAPDKISGAVNVCAMPSCRRTAAPTEPDSHGWIIVVVSRAYFTITITVRQPVHVHANLAVSLDRPLMGPGMTNRFHPHAIGKSYVDGMKNRSSPKLVLTTGVLRPLLAIVMSDAFKVVATAVGLA
eukprot:scaffold128373_cov45-Attheya_sp.AAC.2